MATYLIYCHQEKQGHSSHFCSLWTQVYIHLTSCFLQLGTVIRKFTQLYSICYNFISQGKGKSAHPLQGHVFASRRQYDIPVQENDFCTTKLNLGWGEYRFFSKKNSV